jgi:hypothetical protein
MRADHRRLPFTIGTGKHASCPEAFAASVQEKILPRDCKLRRVKYLNNVIEQDHRAIRRRRRAMQCFRSFHTAERTIEGVEALHMMRKGQVKRLDGRRLGGAGEVRRELVRSCCVDVDLSTTFLTSDQSLQLNCPERLQKLEKQRVGGRMLAVVGVARRRGLPQREHKIDADVEFAAANPVYRL